MVGIERSSRIRSDAAIGVVLSSFFSLGVVLLTAIAHGNDADQAGLDRYLFGQAAGLAERDVVVTGIIGLGAVAIVALAFRPLKATLFDSGYAAAAGLPVRLLELGMTALLVVAVVVGVRMVGAILMVAMLVVPATAARQLTGRLSTLLPVAGLIGAAVGVGGALLSASAEAPTGPVIVLLGVSRRARSASRSRPAAACCGGRASWSRTAAARWRRACSSISPPGPPRPPT